MWRKKFSNEAKIFLCDTKNLSNIVKKFSQHAKIFVRHVRHVKKSLIFVPSQNSIWLTLYTVPYQFLLEISHRFCPNCGEPFSKFAALECLDEEGIICYYFNSGFTYRNIVAALKKRYDLPIS